MEDHYKIVESPNSSFYALQFKEPSPFPGVRIIYGTVSIKENIEMDLATLSFTYNISDPGDWDHDDLRENKTFNDYLGDILSSILENTVEGQIGKPTDDTHTESPTQ